MKFLLIPALLLMCSFKFTPMSQSIVLDESNIAKYMVENTTSKPIPLSFKVTTREQNLDGTEINHSTDDLLIFPPQLIVPPGQKRGIKVKWQGEKSKIEKAYRVIAEQLPIEPTKGKKTSGINMLLKYKTALYVSSSEVESDVLISKVEVKSKSVFIHIQNKGTKHQLLKDLFITLNQGEKKVDLSTEQIKHIEGQNILAQTTRIFEVDVILNQSEAVTGALKFE